MYNQPPGLGYALAPVQERFLLSMDLTSRLAEGGFAELPALLPHHPGAGIPGPSLHGA